MAGLLDLMGDSVDDPKTMGLLSLAASLSSGRKFMPALAQGLLARQGILADAENTKQKRAMMDLQMQQHQLGLQEAQRQAAQQQALADAAKASMRSPTEVGMAGGGGPTAANLERVQNAQPQFDWGGYASRVAGIDPMRALQIQQMTAKAGPKLSKLEAMAGPDGKLVNVAVFEDGTSKVLPYGVKPEMVFQDLGGRVAAIDKNAIPSGTTLGKSMTPGETASNALGWSRLKFDQNQANNAVTYQQDADGNFVALPTKAAPGQLIRGSAVAAPGGMAPLQGKGAGMTEDQAKATGWLVQARNARQNMLDAISSNPGASKPGLPDAIEAIPGLGAAANTLRSADRQKFMQAAGSFSEATLRAATGAGVNKDEAAQKIRELTPQWGDSDAVIAQKMASQDLYLKSLEVRSGPGMKKADSIFRPGATNAPVSGLKFLGFEGQ